MLEKKSPDDAHSHSAGLQVQSKFDSFEVLVLKGESQPDRT